LLADRVPDAYRGLGQWRQHDQLCWPVLGAAHADLPPALAPVPGAARVARSRRACRPTRISALSARTTLTKDQRRPGLTRCTAARGTCTWSCRAVRNRWHLTDTSAVQHEDDPRFAWSGKLCGYLRLRPQPTRTPPSSAGMPDPNWRAMVFAAAAAVLWCFTRPWTSRLRCSNYAFDLGWTYWDSNPDLLHAIQRHHVHRSPSVQVTVPVRPHQSAGIQAGCCTFVLYSLFSLAGPRAFPQMAKGG
jgi:hypothetical protein